MHPKALAGIMTSQSNSSTRVLLASNVSSQHFKQKHSGFDTLIILVDFVQAEGVSDGQSQTRNNEQMNKKFW